MPVFHYKAATASGDIREGEMEAGSLDALIKQLQLQGYVPIRAEDISRQSTVSRFGRDLMEGLQKPVSVSRSRASGKDVALITLELSTLLQSGLPLAKALEIMVDLAESDALRTLLTDVQRRVRGGSSLSSAMEAQGSVFSRFYLNIVRAGEASGALDASLARLSEFLERSREMRDSLLSALVYPFILLGLSVVSIVVLLAFVVPRFSTMFEEAGQALPLPTQIVVAVGAAFESYWWVLVLLIAGGFAYGRAQLRNPATRLRWDRRFLGLPLVGGLIARVEASRFSRTLGTLLSSGVPLQNAITIAMEIINNRVVAEAAQDVSKGIREGRGLARPLMEAGVFPRLTGHMLQVGEETGRLDEMLLKLAAIYDREVQTTMRRLLAFVEPALILGLGGLIAGIIMSVLVAVLRVNQLAF